MGMSCLVIKKKLQNTLKGKNHNLRGQSKHQNQTWQRFSDYQSGNFEQLWLIWIFPSGSVVKNPPASVGDTGSNPGLGRSLEKEMSTYSSILARKIPWREEAGGPQSMGWKESDTTEVVCHTGARITWVELVSPSPCEEGMKQSKERFSWGCPLKELERVGWHHRLSGDEFE